MYTQEPKLKAFVGKYNKRNAKIALRKKQDEVSIKYSYEKKAIKLKEDKPKWKKKNKKA